MTHHKNLNAARLHDGTIAFVLRAVAGDEQRLAAVELPKRDGRYGFSLVNPRNSLARLLADRFQRCEPGLRLHRRKVSDPIYLTLFYANERLLVLHLDCFTPSGT